MRVIGTAGHVDHGKSTLVEALTGINPDRLKEEREREMTIDLGFAWMKLPGGEEVGIVDVPGHRDFVENMLAGIGGIDAALFVVAADEGVMPQTREHLAILDVLQIQAGVVALTKIDLIDTGDLDQTDWLDLVEEEIRQVMRGTILEDAAVIRVSARKHIGLDELREALRICLSGKPSRPDLGKPRLPVDRIFTISGFGTVVTGTLSDGILNIGDEVEILPNGLRGRVRGLQTHQRKQESVVPGSRTAINISGVNIDQIRRGDVVAKPGVYQPTRRLDVHFRLLTDIERPLKHNTEVKFFLGSAEVVARVRLLGIEEIKPGQVGWLQLELREPVVAVRGDRYILRRPSPGETLGGGNVVDPHPKGRHKRFRGGLLARLESLSRGTPAEILLQASLALGAAPIKDVVARSSLESVQANEAMHELVDNDQLLVLEGSIQEIQINSGTLVIPKSAWDPLKGQALDEVERFHRDNPLRRGIPREELKSRLKLSPRLFNVTLHRLVEAGNLEEMGPLVFRPGYQIQFSEAQEDAIRRLMSTFEASPYMPPSVKEARKAIGDVVYNALIDLGMLVPVSEEVVFRKEDYDRMVAEIRGLLHKHHEVTAAQVRDHFNTSRRYALAILEHLDARGVTVREGDVRKLKLEG
jgi:selenocysteine-specific elongation factor